MRFSETLASALQVVIELLDSEGAPSVDLPDQNMWTPILKAAREGQADAAFQVIIVLLGSSELPASTLFHCTLLQNTCFLQCPIHFACPHESPRPLSSTSPITVNPFVRHSYILCSCSSMEQMCTRWSLALAKLLWSWQLQAATLTLSGT